MTLRTDYSGALRSSDIGRTVTVCGWVARRREHGEHLAFIDVRDHTGIVQCVVDGAADLRNEFVVQVTGTVRARLDGTVNDALATGEVEIGDCDVEILNASEPPPFPIDDRVESDESVRLRYRYLDLRRDRMQKNMRVRAVVNQACRNAMAEQDFVEIETPMLIASTPEGARDFVVPSRLQPGSFYVLPQSPQLFKQLCMVGGLDRYFQVARCLRDEDLRADRQFEFMQLDLEMSFAGQDDVLAATSHAIAAAVKAVTGEDIGPIPTMPWIEAQERFGSDKPDLRFGMELIELTQVFAGTEFNAFKASCVKGLRVDGGAEFTRSRLGDLTDMAKRYGAKGLVWMRVTDDGVDSPVAKFLAAEEISALKAATEAQTGDLLLLVADERPKVRHVLGLLRVELGRRPVTEGGLHFTWIVDFPLFEADDNGEPQAAHHLFTMPNLDDLDRLESDPLSVRAQSYDLVLNGWELGSGSVRIHRSDIQQRVFDKVGIKAEEAQVRFGFLLDAFKYGAPPHAGFAFGLDRLVAILAGEENIREVIAFPKTQSGLDLLTGAPSPIEQFQLEELRLRHLPPL
ncbi:MAG: aspartate--tRNA ligase [Acidimicrobiales bacterium]|nr:aspartate--tRNA ligase [Acidimicrobiales bacterium]